MNVVVTEKVVKVITVDWKSLGNAVKQEVIDKLNDDLLEWQRDPRMLSMFLNDAADGMNVAVHLSGGDWRGAENKLRDMDTASREYAWEWVEKHSCKNIFNILDQQAT